MTKAKKSGEDKTDRQYQEIMIVNDDPGVQTRIAILENQRLEELYTERSNAATGVGNIYKGRVTNVEPSIQAAFIEYGGTQSGFLHVTDLHPKYFPGKDTSERVGKKIAKHNRPPIQKCLKRGDEVLVQVLKEGIGTKGPTLTSYLSIPGRLVVMMPFMDKVGVSRKIEDEDERRDMRKTLDALQLPKGFGFILRTAGMGKKKTEIKRDVAYLVRLWKMIEKRISTVSAPCQLYNESDLLVRTIRDVLRPSIDAIIVDSESSHQRITSFLKVAAPRSAKKVIHYQQNSPIFHAFNIEHQIDEAHCREVSLPSGGRLVIDQTEALVAIDVNSGKSRDAKNSETNALHTNLEAADEICRQLRLRDLGGLVINDLIDMGKSSNRRKVEQRFTDNLERDRARTTTLAISRFGLLEMTRQRIRPSLLDSHYVGCTHCDGRGLIKTSEEVSADATRHCGWLLQHDAVKRVELTCSPSVGTQLLSNRRAELEKYEKNTRKRIVVRISDEIATDRVSYYAYDERGADIELASLKNISPPFIDELLNPKKQHSSPKSKKNKRSRRKGKSNAPVADASSVLNEIDNKESKTKTSRSKKKKPTKKKNRKNTPAEKAIRVYQFAKSMGKTSKEVVDLCKEHTDEVRGHMSTMTSELVTIIKKKVEEERPKQQKKRRSRSKGKSNATPATRNAKKKKVVSEKHRTSTKKSRKRTKKTSKKIVNKEANPRRTLYGGRRRSITTEELSESMADRT